MSELLAVLGSESLCKTHIFKFKSAVLQLMTSFQYFGNFHKHHKNTKIHQNLKNVKTDRLSSLHRYEVISCDMKVIWASYSHYYVLNSFVKRISSSLKVLRISQQGFSIFWEFPEKTEKQKNSAKLQKCQK